MLPWQSDRTLNQQIVQEIITAQFPTLDLSTIERIGEGWDNTAWLIDNQWIFRFPKHENAATLMINELRLLPSLRAREAESQGA